MTLRRDGEEGKRTRRTTRLPRVLVPAVLVLLTVAASAPRANAANPCKASCRTTKRTCRVAANTTFKNARTACKALADRSDRKACMKTARGTRRSERRACNTTFRSCKQACGGGGGGTGGGCTNSAFGGWLASMNGFRALAGLAPVAERADWSADDLAHAEYVTRNDQVVHPEDPGNPFYSDAGNTGGLNGNVTGTSDPNGSEGWAIDSWMTAPFHQVGILDPTLVASGFGIFHDTSGSVQTGATLDVIRGLTGSTAGIAFPVLYPGDGGVVPLDRYGGNESPDPLTACPGYTPPTGPPLVVMVAPGTTPAVTAHEVTEDGVAVESCVFDGTTYTNPTAATQTLARSILAARQAIVVMPRQKLKRGSTYAVSVTTNGAPIAWSFTACQ